jgi:hypothetical protein
MKRPNLFFEISRVNEANVPLLVYRSEVVRNTFEPKWREFRISMVTLCNGDPRCPVVVEFFDHDGNDGDHVSKGKIKAAVERFTWENYALNISARGNPPQAVGRLTTPAAVIDKKSTFPQFLMGGLNMNVVVAIDFTGSNGNPRDADSLHFIGATNPYEIAIKDVVKLIEEYDTDKKYPVFGFGARVLQSNGSFGPAQHCFPLHTGIGADGADGILSVYRQKIGQLMFAGPTLISPAIEQTSAAATCSQQHQQYTVLLILTDGVINDMDETLEAIIEASDKPMSIIILGVGNANFEEMGAFNGQISFNGTNASRATIQFLTMTEATNVTTGSMAARVLENIPAQVLHYMQINGIYPNAPAHAEVEDVAEEIVGNITMNDNA